MTETALFELETPPVRPGRKGYLEYLSGLTYLTDDQPDQAWDFWALAPVHRHWRADEPGPVEHVWLSRPHALALALVDVRTGQIIRTQRHPGPAPGSPAAAMTPAPSEESR